MCKILFLLPFFLLPALVPAFQNISTCSANSYFDTSLMNCLACPANQTLNQTSGLTCSCQASYITSDQSQIGFLGTCLACSAVIRYYL